MNELQIKGRAAKFIAARPYSQYSGNRNNIKVLLDFLKKSSKTFMIFLIA